MPTEPALTDLGPCTWLVQVRNPAFNDPEWYPDSPSDVHVIVPCGAPTRVVKVSAYGTHTCCDAGHAHDPYGSPESEASLWAMEMQDRYDDY